MKILKQLEDIFSLHLEKIALELEQYDPDNFKNKCDLETGRKFSNIINSYPISEEILLNICEEFAEFNLITTISSIKDYLFIDYEKGVSRLLSMISDINYNRNTDK